MSLLETIRKDQLQSRRERCAFGTALLTTLLSEASMPGKNAGRESTDLEVLAVVKKFIDNINETINALSRNSEYHVDERVNVARLERDLLMKYVPTQKTEIELRIIISDYIEILGEKSPKQMGKIMGMLKTEYAGLYDGNLASKLVKELLQN